MIGDWTIVVYCNQTNDCLENYPTVTVTCSKVRNLDSESTGICTPVQCLYDSDCPDVGDTCFGTGGMKGKFRIIIWL